MQNRFSLALSRLRRHGFCAVLFVAPLVACSVAAPAMPGAVEMNRLLSQHDAWYGSEEAIRIADNVLLFQRANGGWPRNRDMTALLSSEERAALLSRKHESGASIDNNGTFPQVRFLARVHEATDETRFRAAALAGVDYLLDAQYVNGGWPQFWPVEGNESLRNSAHNPRDLAHFVTLNDDAMAGVATLLLAVARGERPFGFVDAERRERARRAVERAVDLLIDLQVVANGRATGWAAQYDNVTLEPRWGRKFEPVSIAGRETVGILRFLMRLEDPTPEVVSAIQSGVAWLDAAKLRGVRVQVNPEIMEVPNWDGTRIFTDRRDRTLVEDPAAPPLWARFYEIGTDRPVFASDDDTTRYDHREITPERRSGYDWYGDWPRRLLDDEYPAWARRHGLFADGRVVSYRVPQTTTPDLVPAGPDLRAMQPPYPPSAVIRSLTFAAADSIRCAAEDGDNWPVTWGADGAIYTTWGDGTGFEPKVPVKLSMGFARVTGGPRDFVGENIRSPNEQMGSGRFGKKGWGILSVDGILYLWLGHADQQGGQAQLSWSEDGGHNWTAAPWFFEQFGLVGFVNYGRDYAGARDDFVYAYSHDSPRPDLPADRFVALRAPRDRLTERTAWEFLERVDDAGRPVWTRDISRRGAVFTHPGSALRSAMTYIAPLDRYLWWQQIPAPPGSRDRGDTRFEGGFGIYDAPEPWGPWTTVFHTERWDVGPGEHGDFPAKWVSADGRELHLVFSGNDAFCVRSARIELHDDSQAATELREDRRPAPSSGNRAEGAATDTAGTPPGGPTRLATRRGPFAFAYHRVDDFGVKMGQTALADLDNDGDLDWISGQADHAGAGLWWWEYRAPDEWVRHEMGEGNSDVGGAAHDVDGDGWVDFISGDRLLLNPRNPRAQPFSEHEIATIYSHDTEFADVNSDGRVDVIANSDRSGLFWFEIPRNPVSGQWVRHTIATAAEHRVHGGVSPRAVADLDGDRDPDVVTAESWYENLDGRGRMWRRRAVPFLGEEHRYGIAVRSWVGDLDGDGDADVVQSEADNPDGRVAWFENDGAGAFVRHLVQARGEGQDFHALAVADFDLDGDLDLFAAGGPLSSAETARGYIWENTAGAGRSPGASHWTPHVIVEMPAHEVEAADVDGDGDVDIVGKPWSRGSEHFFLENLIRESVD